MTYAEPAIAALRPLARLVDPERWGGAHVCMFVWGGWGGGVCARVRACARVCVRGSWTLSVWGALSSTGIPHCAMDMDPTPPPPAKGPMYVVMNQYAEAMVFAVGAPSSTINTTRYSTQGPPA